MEDAIRYLLRHTGIALLIDNGASIEEVADLTCDHPHTLYCRYRHKTRPVANVAAERSRACSDSGSVLTRFGAGRLVEPRGVRCATKRDERPEMVIAAILHQHPRLDRDVFQMDARMWAIHGCIPVDREVILAEFDHRETAKAVLAQLAAAQDRDGDEWKSLTDHVRSRPLRTGRRRLADGPVATPTGTHSA
jgi:hypothetical protein